MKTNPSMKIQNDRAGKPAVKLSPLQLKRNLAAPYPQRSHWRVFI
jgi:hypothetical protein